MFRPTSIIIVRGFRGTSGTGVKKNRDCPARFETVGSYVLVCTKSEFTPFFSVFSNAKALFSDFHRFYFDQMGLNMANCDKELLFSDSNCKVLANNTGATKSGSALTSPSYANDSEEARVRGKNTPVRPRKCQIRPAISSDSSRADEYSDVESGKIMVKKLMCEDSMKELKSVLQVLCSKVEKNEKSLNSRAPSEVFNHYDIVFNIPI